VREEAARSEVGWLGIGVDVVYSANTRTPLEVGPMVPVNAQRFHLTECNNDGERGFIEALHARAEAGGWYADSWPQDDRIIISVGVSDHTPGYNISLRTLRVDCNGSALWYGQEETQ
jgi:hypothetical protein